MDPLLNFVHQRLENETVLAGRRYEELVAREEQLQLQLTAVREEKDAIQRQSASIHAAQCVLARTEVAIL